VIKGIDVSGYQSDSYDTSGLSFVFIKATQGTSYVNPHQAAQTAHGRSAGLVMGFYHFLEPGNIDAQAAWFVDKCLSQPGDILAVDWESGTNGHASAAEKEAFIKEVKRLRPDHRCILYCNLDFWKNIDQDAYCGDGLWIADYSHAAGHPNIKAAWLFDQYSDVSVDKDAANFADKAALVKWATELTQESTDVALSQDDIDKVAAAVAKLVWNVDAVPAAEPPYNNTDYFKSDGKTPGNTTWGAGYMQRTQVEGIRETLARVKQLQADLATVKSQSQSNGSGISELKLALAAIDPAALEAALVAKLEGLTVDVTVKKPGS